MKFDLNIEQKHTSEIALRIKRGGALFATGLLLISMAIPLTASAAPDKVTICHATSSALNPFVTLTISFNAAYGPGGHFTEEGSLQAGHEEDYLGECVDGSTTTTAAPAETTTTEKLSTTTTMAPSTTTTMAPTTTTMAPTNTTVAPTTTIAAVTATTESTTTTLAPTTTTVAPSTTVAAVTATTESTTTTSEIDPIVPVVTSPEIQIEAATEITAA